MKIHLLIFLFVVFSSICNAQKELLMINREDSTKQVRIPKGSLLMVKTLSGQKYSGTLVELKKFDIVLWNYTVNVDVDEIAFIRVLQSKSGLTLLPVAGGLVSYQSAKYYSYFKVKDWVMVIKG
jgi:hypothetical protein